jgi:peptide/nickel transport system substrate-binding protein
MSSPADRIPCVSRPHLHARLTVLAIALALSLCACSQPVPNGDVLVFGRNKDALTLDPAVSFDGLSLTVTHVIYEGLTRYRPGTFDVEPCLATSWSVSKDGKKWSFHLRQGVRFQDGAGFDAQAVKFNFDRWRLPDDRFHTGGNFIYWESMFGGFPGRVASVEVRSRYLVEIDLTQPLAPLLADLAMPAFAIASPAALQREGATFFRSPIGTGPYRLGEWVKDDHITLQRFDDYWGPKPRIATVILKDIPDASAALLALQKGEIDGWEYPTPGALATIANEPSLVVYHSPANAAMWLRINVTHHPFDDVRVRMAVAMAIDRVSLVKHFFDPTATVADELLPAAVWPRGVIVDPPYDPARARALLAKAGYPHGFSTTLWYPTASRPYLPEPEGVSEAIQADLRSIGIDARLQGLEWSVWLQRIENGEHDLTVGGWTGDNGDPDNFLYAPFDEDAAHAPGASNTSFWRDPAFHALVLQGQRESDPARRAATYRRALGIVRDQMPAVSIAHTSSPAVFRAAVRGFVPSPDSMISFQDMYFSTR